jgi:hypothetical protein
VTKHITVGAVGLDKQTLDVFARADLLLDTLDHLDRGALGGCDVDEGHFLPAFLTVGWQEKRYGRT